MATYNTNANASPAGASSNSINAADLNELDKLNHDNDVPDEEIEEEKEYDSNKEAHKYHLQTKRGYKNRESYCVDCQIYLGRPPVIQTEDDEDDTV